MNLETLASAIQQRKVSCRELAEATLRRIAKTDPGLDAVTATDEEATLAEADARDRDLAAGNEPGPLFGIPMLSKDTEDAAGFPTTYGSLLHADDPPAAADGVVTGRLRSAGAVVVGRSNVPEFTFEGFTNNRVYGATRNPWNRDLSPGGSSGGSAAALASGQVPIATATDGGGSARVPAAFSGLVGFKPTTGLVGRWPRPAWIDFTTDGVMGTSVADVRLLATVLAGPVDGDQALFPGADVRSVFEDRELPSAIQFVDRITNPRPIPPEIRSRFEAALKTFRDGLGMAVEPAANLPGAFGENDPDQDWDVIASAEMAHYIGRDTIEARGDRLERTLRQHLLRGLNYNVDEYLAARRRTFLYTEVMDRALRHSPLLVSPTMLTSGYPATGPYGGSHPDDYNTQIQNITGHPAISLPAGQLGNGLPFGIQITAPRGADGLLLAIASAWERVAPWAPVAPGYEEFRI